MDFLAGGFARKPDFHEDGVSEQSSIAHFITISGFVVAKMFLFVGFGASTRAIAVAAVAATASAIKVARIILVSRLFRSCGENSLPGSNPV
jgi:hypothetical protein